MRTVSSRERESAALTRGACGSDEQGIRAALELVHMFLQQPAWNEAAMARAKQAFITHYRSQAMSLDRGSSDRMLQAMLGSDRCAFPQPAHLAFAKFSKPQWRAGCRSGCPHASCQHHARPCSNQRHPFECPAARHLNHASQSQPAYRSTCGGALN